MDTNIDLKTVVVPWIKQALIWGTIFIGIIHQFSMFIDHSDKIPFISPPGDIYPLVSLEYTWWVILTFTSSVLCQLTYTDRIRPRRLVYPFYMYLVFLLILVKPV